MFTKEGLHLLPHQARLYQDVASRSYRKNPISHRVFSLVEHLEDSSPLIVEEMHRWRDLLWGDWLDHQQEGKRRKELSIP